MGFNGCLFLKTQCNISEVLYEKYHIKQFILVLGDNTNV